VPGQCAPTGIFDVVDESAPDPYAPLLALPAGFILYPSGDRDVTQMRLGGRILSQDESLVSQAKAVRMTYRTDSDLWEDQFLEMLEKDHKNELATKVQSNKNPPPLPPRWASRVLDLGLGVWGLPANCPLRISGVGFRVGSFGSSRELSSPHFGCGV
jgi:hypothetical protein